MSRILLVCVCVSLMLSGVAQAQKKSCASRSRLPQRVTHVWVPKPGEVTRKAAPAKAPCVTARPQQFRTTTLWQARPTVVNVNQVQTVMTTQWQY
jgi:hypothetical protein